MFSSTKKVKDFNEFVEQLRSGSPSRIIIEASREPATGLFKTSLTGAVGRLGQYDHALLYTVKFGKKTRRYWEPMFSAFQSERGFADAEERNKRVMAVLLAGEERVNYLREQFPGIDIQLGNGRDEPFTPDILAKLHAQAKEYGVAPAAKI